MTLDRRTDSPKEQGAAGDQNPCVLDGGTVQHSRAVGLGESTWRPMIDRTTDDAGKVSYLCLSGMSR